MTDVTTQRPKLADTLAAYEAALQALPQAGSDSVAAEGPILTLLTARDQVAHTLAHADAVSPPQLQRLIALDKELQECRNRHGSELVLQGQKHLYKFGWAFGYQVG
jgi:hypothetical protein